MSAGCPRDAARQASPPARGVTLCCGGQQQRLPWGHELTLRWALRVARRGGELKPCQLRRPAQGHTAGSWQSGLQPVTRCDEMRLVRREIGGETGRHGGLLEEAARELTPGEEGEQLWGEPGWTGPACVRALRWVGQTLRKQSEGCDGGHRSPRKRGAWQAPGMVEHEPGFGFRAGADQTSCSLLSLPLAVTGARPDCALTSVMTVRAESQSMSRVLRPSLFCTSMASIPQIESSQVT